MEPRQQAPDTTTPRRRRGFERAVSLLARDLRGPAEKRGFAETRLLTHWAEIVGPEIAAMAVPVRIRYGRGFGGTLVLLTTGARAPVLEMSRGEIVTRVNACYGYSAINDVAVTQTAPTGFAEGQVAFAPPAPAARPAPDPARLADATQGLERIGDTALREALHRLAANIVSRANS